MQRIHIHWTAGGHKANAVDKRHYHFIVEDDGNVVQGDKLPEANLNTADGDYAAHTRAANTGAIGVAFAAMRGAKERPFDAGPSPITHPQLQAMAKLCADLADGYGIPVTRETVLTHAEVQPTLGVKQRGKWDVMWLPGMSGTGDPVIVGDQLRQLIRAEQQGYAGTIQRRIPNEVERVVDDADKSPAKSTTNWAAVIGIVQGGWVAFQSADPIVQASAILGMAVLAYILRERIRKAKLGKAAKEALGL